MPYGLIEAAGYLLYALKWLAIFLATLMLLFGLDDLLMDILYWGRQIWRRLSVYRHHERADEKRLQEKPEQPLAIMIPAWQEVGVIGQMAELAASTLDYENYQIFVGTYPNDPDTQAEVDAVCVRFPNVHKVVCARPGPTTKADCLNNVIEAMLRFEKAAQVEFAGFVLHDAEDVTSSQELRLFNYLLPDKDLIQVPVYPFPPHWYEFTSAHYIDEFAENHAKDMVVREALMKQVPSAGVGTCFSRRAFISLLEDSDGQAFDVQSLTEDYEIGMRLAARGMKGIFARYAVSNEKLVNTREKARGISSHEGNIICVREHFPRTLHEAVRQKSRWIVGIVFQGMHNLGWSRSPLINYFLWRDRRGAITNFVGLLVTLLFLVGLLLWGINLLFADAWHFPSLLEGSGLLMTLLMINGLLLLNRIFHRFYFVKLYYGFMQGLLSFPRMIWSNLINFLAVFRALKQVLIEGDSHRVAWDKTAHEFPSVDTPRQKPIGRRLVELGAITEEQLNSALLAGTGRRLGRELLMRGMIDSHQLARVLAEQAEVEWRPLNPFTISDSIIRQFPERLALRYCVLPVVAEGRTLVIASEKAVSQVVLGALNRQLDRPVRFVIVPQGRITVGLRYWYGKRLDSAATEQLAWLKDNWDDTDMVEAYCLHQVLLGDLIQEMGILPTTVFAQALFSYDPERHALGEFLVQKGLISEETLARALTEQSRQQQHAQEMLETSS